MLPLLRPRPLALVVGLAAAVSGFGQAPPTGGVEVEAARVDALSARIARLDVLSKILPINLQKPQIEGLLVALEKARAKQKEVLKLDTDELGKLDGDVTKAIEAAYEKSAVPPRELQARIVQVTAALALRRQLAFGEMTTIVDEAVDKLLDVGQRAVMANTLKPELMDPSLKGKTLSPEERERFFIRTFLMNDSAYEILLRMGRSARSGS